MTTTEMLWLGIGFLGQGMFFARWLVQWLASERHAESRMPIAFWYMSLIGGLITLAYAIYRQDPVFIAGQSVGAVVYVRNLMLIRRPTRTGAGDDPLAANGSPPPTPPTAERPAAPDRSPARRNA